MNITHLEEGKPWWNIIITAREDGFNDAKRALKHYGTVESTNFFNVLVAHVGKIDDFLHDFALEYSAKPYLRKSISRIRPLTHTFIFNSKEEFEAKVRDVIAPWINRMKGKTFHVRIHRRGKKVFSALSEEQFLDLFILSMLRSQGHSVQVSFNDPDFIIDVETVDNEAGVSIWGREDLKKCYFLNIE